VTEWLFLAGPTELDFFPPEEGKRSSFQTAVLFLEYQTMDEVRKATSFNFRLIGLDDRGSRVRFPAGAGNSSLHHSVHNGSGAYPVSYPMGTRGSFLGGKAAGP
jgi:hypothetical protein